MMPCKHNTVAPDPLLGGYFCTNVQCLQTFKTPPIVPIAAPVRGNLWARLKWAFKSRRRARIDPFVWSLQWAQRRDTSGRPPWLPSWGHAEFRKRKVLTDTERDRVYNHPASRQGRGDKAPVTRIK